MLYDVCKDSLDLAPEMLDGRILVDVDIDDGGAADIEDTTDAPRKERRSRCGDSRALSLLLTTERTFIWFITTCRKVKL